MARVTGRPEILDICRRYTKERERLMPYILKEAKVSADTGRPLMAALVIDWPEDKEACAVDNEYMFGSRLLVAPVLEEGVIGRQVYLPKGNWINYWTGEQTVGPCRLYKECREGEILVWYLN
jgi:alpha-D-xyloside xylohydrolase